MQFRTGPIFRNRYLIGLLLLIVVVAGYLWLRPGSAEGERRDSFVVALGNIEETVTAQGKLEAKEYVDVGAQVTGQLQKIHFDIGDDVKAGELLAEIDPRIYQARVQADEANIKNQHAQLVAQQARVLFAKQQFERNRELIRSNGISLQDLQNSATNFKVAEATANSIQAQIEQLQSTLSGDRTNLGYTKIYAPMDGTIVNRTARLGQTLNANQTTPMIMQLAKLDAMTVRAQVAEADVMRLKNQLPVYFTTLGSGERRWSGKVRQILPSPEVVNNVVLYNVLVDVDNSDRQLMTGMSTQMFFVLGSAEQVALLPTPALGARLPEQDNEIGRAYRVRELTEHGPAERIVHVGLQSRRFVELRDGLAVGARVLSQSTNDDNGKARKKDGGYPGGGVPRF